MIVTTLHLWCSFLVLSTLGWTTATFYSPYCLCVRHPTTATSSEFVSSSLVIDARKYDHVTSLLRDHHWLPIAERIEYKLSTSWAHSFFGVYRAKHRVPSWSRGTGFLRQSENLPAICRHFHSGSAENSLIVCLLSFFCCRPVRLDHSSHICSLCPVNIHF